MAQETTLKKLFIDELRGVYHPEKQLVKALPKLAKAASSPDLKAALEMHLEETHEHVSRLEQAFELLDEPAKAKACAGMAGIVEEGSDLVSEENKGAANHRRGSARERYEMAVYGSLMADTETW